MSDNKFNNVKLGAFVLSGILFLVLLLFMIGRNSNLLGSNYELKARLDNVQGLIAGNNVRFAGIQTGTVKKIRILADTVIEITMAIDTRMKSVIRADARVSIGTEGLVGNKVVNITPSGEPSPFADEGAVLAARKSINTEDMLQLLSQTNNDVAIVADGLKTTVKRLNEGNSLWSILNDRSLPASLHRSLLHISIASAGAADIMNKMDSILSGVKNGQGTAGALLKDTALYNHLDQSVLQLKRTGEKADSLMLATTGLIQDIRADINEGKGTMHAVLKDTLLVNKLNAGLDNIEKGAAGFHENMEALKHSIFFRGYFRKINRQQQNKPTSINQSN